MGEPYNTNLAAEFHVLSALYRLGMQANLTLGNRKSVDIVVVRDAGDAVTIDVKGPAGDTGWPVENVKSGRANHFMVFVGFKNKIEDLKNLPEIYVVPSERLAEITYSSPNSKRKVVRASLMRKPEQAEFRDAWHLILENR